MGRCFGTPAYGGYYVKEEHRQHWWYRYHHHYHEIRIVSFVIIVKLEIFVGIDKIFIRIDKFFVEIKRLLIQVKIDQLLVIETAQLLLVENRPSILEFRLVTLRQGLANTGASKEQKTKRASWTL
jgi:hypothetical protein